MVGVSVTKTKSGFRADDLGDDRPSAAWAESPGTHEYVAVLAAGLTPEDEERIVRAMVAIDGVVTVITKDDLDFYCNHDKDVKARWAAMGRPQT